MAYPKGAENGSLNLPIWGCPHPHPEATWTSSFRDTLAPPYRRTGHDLMLAVGLLRFGLNLPEKNVMALLGDGWSIPLSQPSISRLSTEFLVRWGMLCEERIPPLLPTLQPLVIQIDGTVVENGPVTFRARDARTGLTLLAEQLEVESHTEVVRFLRDFKTRYGNPVEIVRDGSPTLREAVAEVFPGVPQQEDHWHFLDDLGPVILADYPSLQVGLTGDHGLSRLAEWSRKLPVAGSTLGEIERVWIRLALEWLEEPRRHAGGFPWRLPYLEIVRRMEKVLKWARELHRVNADRRVVVPALSDLIARLGGLLSREAVRESTGRLMFEVPLWEGVRAAMRTERDRRSREDLAPLAEADIAGVQKEIDEAGTRFVTRGGWAEAIWAKVSKRLEDHRKYLWVVVPGLGVVIRSTVALERAHRDDRHGVIRRRGQGDTGTEMGRSGSLLAYWSNARCPFFVEHVLSGVNLWEEFAQQDVGEVRLRLSKLSTQGQRPTVAVPIGEREEKLRELVRILSQPGEVDTQGLTGWAASVGAVEAVSADDGV